jgi:hypothetical protein
MQNRNLHVYRIVSEYPHINSTCGSRGNIANDLEARKIKQHIEELYNDLMFCLESCCFNKCY